MPVQRVSRGKKRDRNDAAALPAQRRAVARPISDSWEVCRARVYSPEAFTREMALYELPHWHARGQDVGEVLALALSDPESMVARAAAIVVARLAVQTPAVLGAIERRLPLTKGRLRRAMVNTLSRLGAAGIPILLRLLGENDPFLRQFVVHALQNLGEHSMLPLVKVLADPSRRRAAATALAGIGRPVVDHVLPLLRHDDPEVRYTATEVLEQIGPIVVPRLVEHLKQMSHPDSEAGEALVRFGPDAIPELIQTLYSPEVEHRCWAAALLVKIGTRAVPALIRAIREGNTSVGWLAGKALVQIGSAAVPDVVLEMSQGQGASRWILADVLAQIGEQAVYALEDVLQDSNDSLRELAAHTLGEMGSVAWVALPSLRTALNGETDANMRQVLGIAIEKLELFEA
jgi:HEAT repeat protein